MGRIRDGDRRLGARLRDERRTRYFKASVVLTRLRHNHYTLAAVSARIGVSKSLLHAWEVGQAQPSLAQRRLWCAALELNFADLLEDIFNAPEQNL